MLRVYLAIRTPIVHVWLGAWSFNLYQDIVVN